MKRLLSTIVMFGMMGITLFAFPGLFTYPGQFDYFILRTGEIVVGTVSQIDDAHVTYKLTGKKNSPQMQIDTKDVYMIHFVERGNVYVTAEGKRVTGEKQTIDKDADVIYLVGGKEIQAYNLQVSGEKVSYEMAKRTKKNRFVQTGSIPSSEVFLIVYKDGMKDIVTELVSKEKEEAKPAEKQTGAQEKQDKEETTEELQVIFHNVARNETLATIANRYGVTVPDIIEWNELPANLKGTARLQTGMQLMIYVKTVSK